MTTNTSKKEYSLIPILDLSNFSEWHGRITILLKSKELMEVCKNHLESGATTIGMNKWNKLSTKAANIIPSQIIAQIAKRAILELGAVNRIVKPEVLTFTLLKNLSSNATTQKFVEVLTLNDELIEQPELFLSRFQDYYDNSKYRSKNQVSHTPSALVSESAYPYEITHYCANGKHNLNCIIHSKEEEFSENHHLKPCQKTIGETTATTTPQHISQRLKLWLLVKLHSRKM
ncbi:hypothetical protein O181_013373 [Austropuccinia psidii MF-1]|uniref:Uncharacterized protein n=1 Tax=Austropuccinia psidii MF-1 TaxID=1389203 RepID=A0A9Q3BYK2_9BASI|nr:hypothetical protein [Austropuccinia psidii MF-1]